MPKIRCGSITSLSPRARPKGPSQLADALAQLGKLDPRGPRGLREQAGARQPRQRVGFQTEDVPLGGRPEVDAGVAPQLQGAVGGERQLLELAGETRVHLRG